MRRPSHEVGKPKGRPSKREGPKPDKDPSLPTNERIYVAAARLFIEKGYRGTSMSDIAREVEISKAALYYFVENKEELLFTLMNFGLDRFADQVVNPARAVEDPRERIRVIIRNHLANIGGPTSRPGNPIGAAIATETEELTEEHRGIIDARKAEYLRLVKQTLQELRDRGDMQEGIDLTVAAHTLIGMIVWMPEWRRPHGRLSFDDVVDQITNVALGGLLRSSP